MNGVSTAYDARDQSGRVGVRTASVPKEAFGSRQTFEIAAGMLPVDIVPNDDEDGDSSRPVVQLPDTGRCSDSGG